jgi:hypothetical protein
MVTFAHSDLTEQNLDDDMTEHARLIRKYTDDLKMRPRKQKILKLRAFRAIRLAIKIGRLSKKLAPVMRDVIHKKRIFV